MEQISIIMPVYNGAKYIETAVNSVISQTNTNFELLIVDDGSTDNTAHVIKNICDEDKRVRYIYKNNGGVSSARNRGLVEARGEYISFLDCDDSYENEFLEKCLLTIKQNSADYCVCWAKINEFKKTSYYRPRKTKYELIDFMKFKTRIRINGILIKKSLIEKYNINFNENMKRGEDHHFIYMIISVGKPSYINQILCSYNYIEGSLSNRQPPPKIEKFNGRLFDSKLDEWFRLNREHLKVDFDLLYSERRKILGTRVVRYYWRYVYYHGVPKGIQREEYLKYIAWYRGELSVKGVLVIGMRVLIWVPKKIQKPIACFLRKLGLIKD